MKKHKNKIITGIIILFVLALVYWWGGNAPSLRGWSPAQTTDLPIESTTTNQGQEPTKDNTENLTTEKEKPFLENSQNTEYTAEKSNEEQVTETTQTPEPVKEADTPETELFCTLSVRCDTILSNLDWLDKNKASLVPADGIIYPETEVVFYEGESVFNVLSREMKKNKIHLEFMSTPIYNSAYIEGISNLYEYDCGELSGWMYKVNGVFPNYGCSRHILKSGDRIEWVYTCDLGADVGNRNLSKQKDE